MKCANCGKEIHSVLVDTFNRDGSDSWRETPIDEPDKETGCVAITASRAWTGYDEFEEYSEECMESVVCPFCKKWPFTEKTMDLDEPVYILAWSKTKEIEK